MAVDATGFSSKLYQRWHDVRESRRKKRKAFIKLHFCVDAFSLLIYSFKTTAGSKADSPQLKHLLKGLWNLGKVCADKAYLSRSNCKLIARHGASPFIALKKNVQKIRSKGYPAWRRMIVSYRRDKKAWLKEYHHRSIAESAISSIKRRHGHKLSSTSRRCQKNELSLRVIAHNLCLIARMNQI